MVNEGDWGRGVPPSEENNREPDALTAAAYDAALFSAGQADSPEVPASPEDSPKLKVEEVHRSAKTILATVANMVGPNAAPRIEMTGFESPDRIITQFQGYTVVLNKSRYFVFDDEGNEVGENMPRDAHLTAEWDAIELISAGGKEPNVSESPRGRSNTVEQYPAVTHSYLRRAIREQGGVSMQTPMHRVDTIYSPELESIDPMVLDNGNILMFPGRKHSAYVGYVSNPGGDPVAPRHWKRIDSFTPIDDLPLEAQDIAREIAKVDNRGTARLNDELRIKYALDRVEIYRGAILLGMDPEFKDNVQGIDTSFADTKHPEIIYYYSSRNPQKLIRMDTSADDVGKWAATQTDLIFPQTYGFLNDLKMDPSGTLLCGKTDKGFVILDKDTLEEVYYFNDFCTELWFDGEGKVRIMDAEGYIHTFAMDIPTWKAQAVARNLEPLTVQSPFTAPQAAAGQGPQPSGMEHLNPSRAEYTRQLSVFIDQATTLAQLEDVRIQSIGDLIFQLMGQGLTKEEAKYVTAEAKALLVEKQKTLASQEAAKLIADLRGHLGGSDLTLARLAELKADAGQLDALKGLVDQPYRDQIRILEENIAQKLAEVFRQEAETIKKSIGELVGHAKAELEGFASLTQFTDWREFAYPQYRSRLGGLLQDCPIEATESRQIILDGSRSLQELADQYENTFTTQYAKVREKAADQTAQMESSIRTEIDSFSARLRAKGFTLRSDAEDYISRSGAVAQIEQDIAAMQSSHPTHAEELDRVFNVTKANLLAEVSRGASTQVEANGQQMAAFGSTLFPVWESKVKERKEKKVEVSFAANEASRGPGVQANEVMGDVSVVITNSEGHKEAVRLWESMGDTEDLRRYGDSIKAMGPSYVTKEDFDGIARGYRTWTRDDGASVMASLEAKRKELGLEAVNERIDALYKEAGSSRDGRRELRQSSSELRELRRQQAELLEQYADYYAKQNVGLYKRLDAIAGLPEPEYTNGRGFVPEWQSHWVLDVDTEKNLEKMAELLLMQLETHEGILNLKGHAGTGKDVLVKMFCELAKRPYFPMDCSKWTTEFELSEDVVLEAQDGATQTVKVPSVVLQAVETPGAVMYFNEFNAMPEQAQIFLHGLFDEKRSLTLKTSSGKATKADPSVLFISSMNPGYPGTFDPQFATKSRMVSMDIGYPDQYKDPAEGDPNRNAMLSSSEALRMAREVKSVSRLTYESDADRNEFGMLWDRYVNGVERGGPEPTTLQKYDLDVILAVVQFGNKLRDAFMMQYDGTPQQKRDTSRDLPVTQPFTGREIRRCAYALNKIPLVEKDADPEQVARNLITTFFLSHIDDSSKVAKIASAMETWTSAKRVR